MLSNRITILRKASGLSQAQLAKALNISASAVGMYEQGRREPNIDTLAAMSKLFDVSLDYLITGSEYPNNKQKCHAINKNSPCNTCCWRSH